MPPKWARRPPKCTRRSITWKAFFRQIHQWFLRRAPYGPSGRHSLLWAPRPIQSAAAPGRGWRSTAPRSDLRPNPHSGTAAPHCPAGLSERDHPIAGGDKPIPYAALTDTHHRHAVPNTSRRLPRSTTLTMPSRLMSFGQEAAAVGEGGHDLTSASVNSQLFRHG